MEAPRWSSENNDSQQAQILITWNSVNRIVLILHTSPEIVLTNLLSSNQSNRPVNAHVNILMALADSPVGDYGSAAFV